MSNIVWGETHCPWCGKRIANHADHQEAYVIERQFGSMSAEIADFEASCCRMAHIDEDEMEERIIAVLNERDALRDENERLRTQLSESCYCCRESGCNDGCRCQAHDE